MLDRAGNRFVCDSFDDADASTSNQYQQEIAGDGACTECNCPRFISGGHDNICQLTTCHHLYKAHQ